MRGDAWADCEKGIRPGRRGRLRFNPASDSASREENHTATRNQSVDQSQEDHSNEPTLNTGATRLAKILISEAAYLVWTMRCGRVIGDRSYNNDAIETAWRRTINRRLSEDVTAATKVVRRDEYTKLIISTWRDALHKQHGALPENWINLQPHF